MGGGRGVAWGDWRGDDKHVGMIEGRLLAAIPLVDFSLRRRAAVLLNWDLMFMVLHVCTEKHRTQNSASGAGDVVVYVDSALAVM